MLNSPNPHGARILEDFIHSFFFVVETLLARTLDGGIFQR